jgi:uncharacterized protein (TIGR00251 family)
VAAPDPKPCRITDEGLVVEVHVQPRAGRRGLGGRHGHAVKVRVTAPPAEGRANDETARVLAAALGVAPGAVTLVGGARSRWKRFAVAGDGPVLEARLAAAVAAAEGAP